MKVTPLELDGLLLIEPRVHCDARGFFVQTWSKAEFGAAGIGHEFVQDNFSRSRQGTLRGLHYQDGPGQAKLVRVAAGRIYDVAVDIRPGSPSFGRWSGVYLDDVEHHQLLLPAGFAHGFCVLSESADVAYRISTPYDADTERTLAWDDPELGIDWPVREPVLSERDRAGESLSAYRSRVAR